MFISSFLSPTIRIFLCWVMIWFFFFNVRFCFCYVTFHYSQMGGFIAPDLVNFSSYTSLFEWCQHVFFFFCFILVFYFSTITIGIFCFTHFTLSCIYTKSLFLYHISSCILLLLFLLVECKCFFFLFRAVLVSITLLSVLLLSWKISLESHTFARTHARCIHTIKKMKSSVLLAEQIRPLVQISQALIQIHTKFLAHSLTQFHFYKPTTHSFHFASFC